MAEPFTTIADPVKFCSGSFDRGVLVTEKEETNLEHFRIDD